MHILSSNNRDEFLACPQLVRFDYAEGSHGFEPTLLVKGSTLLLKYLAMSAPMQLIFARIDERLMYAIKVVNDPEKPAVLWSILERDEENKAILALCKARACRLFLFNEIAVNVAEAEISIELPTTKMRELLSRLVIGRIDHSVLQDKVAIILDGLRTGAIYDDVVLVELRGISAWTRVKNALIKNDATPSSLDLFDADEGNQQEQIAVWLTDNLHPLGAYHSPQITVGAATRELTDILLSHEYGSILIESKALSILARSSLPCRAKLTKDVSSHIKKAISQLRGGIRKIKGGVPISKRNGDPIEIERSNPAHAIVLVPDLDLVEDRLDYGVELMTEFMEATGGFLHLVDISELLRIVQASEMLAKKGKSTTTMMAFDFYLMERASLAAQNKTLCVEVLLRLV
jgi:hypothetical protein